MMKTIRDITSVHIKRGVNLPDIYLSNVRYLLEKSNFRGLFFILIMLKEDDYNIMMQINIKYDDVLHLSKPWGTAEENEFALTHKRLYILGLVDIDIVLLDKLREGLHSDGVSLFIHDSQVFRKYSEKIP